MRFNQVLVSKRGQIASLDLSIAFITVLTIVTYTLLHHHSLIHTSVLAERKIKSQRALYEATESLLTTPGKPLDWESNLEDLKRIGMAKYSSNSVQNHEIDSEKVNKIRNMPLSQLKKGLNLENEKIRIELEGINGKTVLRRGNLEEAFTQITRIALYRGDIHVLKLQIQ